MRFILKCTCTCLLATFRRLLHIFHYIFTLWKVLKLPSRHIFHHDNDIKLLYFVNGTCALYIFESVKFCKTDILTENYLYTVEVWTSFEQSANTLRPLARGPNCTVTLKLENALINISRDKLRINVPVPFAYPALL